jgi:hypothetical protein
VRLAHRPADVVVATVTRARSPGEAALIERSLTALSRLGLSVVACDSGSSPAALERFVAIPRVAFVAADHAGLTGQIKASVRAAAASDAPFILYTESDKAAFCEGAAPAFLASARPGGEPAGRPGVVLAARSDASFRTFPETQRHTEAAFNTVAGALLGARGDYLFGPFLMTAALAREVQDVGPDLGWGWRPYLFARAWRLGLVVTAVEGEHECPPEGRVEDDEERLHRLRQLRENIDGLTRGWATAPPDRT